MQSLREIALFLDAYEDLRNLILTVTLGSVLSMFVSTLSDDRRSSRQIIAGSLLGGVAAGVIFRFMAFRPGWEFAVVAAAYVGDKVALGVRRVAGDFSKSPFNTVQKWFALVSAIGDTIRKFQFNDSSHIDLPPEDLPPEDLPPVA